MKMNNTDNFKNKSIVMLGATGTAGRQVLKALLAQEDKIQKITLLGRRKINDLPDTKINIMQAEVDIFNPETYQSYLEGHDVAICTLGVGEPSSVSKEELVKVDKTAVVDFAVKCKNTGVKHFEILSSVNADASSNNFYLKVKGELNEELQKVNFERLSIFQPSLIITPKNRFGFSQWLLLKSAPFLNPLLVGSLNKYRGILAEDLGKAIVLNLFLEKTGTEILHWKEFTQIID